MDILFEKMFFEPERWEKAIATAKEKGIDKSELSLLCDPNIRVHLAERILNGNYAISPPHMQLIPKDKPGEFRTVYINENIDRVFLSMVNDLLMEMFRDMIHPACKSYQTGIGCGKVVKEVVSHLVNIKGNNIGWKSDLSKYFDSVPLYAIDELFDMIEKKIGKSSIIDVVRLYYHQDWCFDTDGNLIQHYQSLKQGCAVASFLADALLCRMDDKLSNFAKERGGYYCRYSDDCLYIGSCYELAMDMMKTELAKFKLTLNPKKVEYLHKDRWFKFLGFNLKGDKITLSKNRVKTFQKEIEKRTIKDRKAGPTRAKNNVNRYLYGGEYSWATSVLPIINVEEDIDELNLFVMDAIRAKITGKTKIGGLGSVVTGDYTIHRGTGQNVKANRQKTPKEIDGYITLRCARNALLTDRAAYETLVRLM